MFYELKSGVELKTFFPLSNKIIKDCVLLFVIQKHVCNNIISLNFIFIVYICSNGSELSSIIRNKQSDLYSNNFYILYGLKFAIGLVGDDDRNHFSP